MQLKRDLSTIHADLPIVLITSPGTKGMSKNCSVLDFRHWHSWAQKSPQKGGNPPIGEKTFPGQIGGRTELPSALSPGFG